MKYSPLGSSGVSVSRICLGSMTWGEQNTQSDADAQIDYALGEGINFIDTAELYAVPPKPETCGATESIIGDWLSRNKSRRDEFVLASKIAGPGLPWIRGGAAMSGQTVIEAVDGSLKRLGTDYIDLFQLHWPNRQSPHFNQHWPRGLQGTGVSYQTENIADTEVQIEGMVDILQGVKACVDAGKIRFLGLSNETPWGLQQYLNLSDEHNLPRVVSMQNEFSLLHAKDWPFMLESCAREDVAYLPWSPIATGILTGKYAGGARPKGSRWTISQRNGLFRDTPHVHTAVDGYLQVAKKHNVTPAQLALLWCDNIDGVTSPIIGATTMAQLKENLDTAKMEMSEELWLDTMEVFRAYPQPF